jgi:hypothetical protein
MRHDAGQVLGGPRLDIRRQHAEGGMSCVVGVGVAGGDLADGHAGGSRGPVDLVVDVGDVARVHQLVTRPQQARQHVEDHGRPGIADMRKAVHRRPADVHRHPPRLQRGKRLFAGAFACCTG